MTIYRFDFLIIGSGIAGLSAAKVLSEHGSTCVITKHAIEEGATRYAQGGIAVALEANDSTTLHLQDTLLAGDGLCREDSVKILVEEAPERIQELISMGVKFDKNGEHFHFTQEAAHSRRRILHAGDATGKEIEKTLGNTLLKEQKTTFFTHTFLLKLLIKDGACIGCLALHQNEQVVFLAKAVILSTGGCGQVFSHNTNPPVSTGDGIALAYDAGCTVEDMEFMQFHPTTLYLGNTEPLACFLISEAARGEGGLLLNVHQERFMPLYHAKAELAPRDVVARAIFDQMHLTKTPHVYLDLRHLSIPLQERFPTIYKHCLDAKIDITKDLIPVAPAAHYCMGGIQVNTWGKTSVDRLYAVGECAALGIHGANRLASNSLLDGLVFGHRAARAAAIYATTPSLSLSELEITSLTQTEADESSLFTSLETKKQIRHIMWTYVGIVRTETGLKEAQKQLSNLSWIVDLKTTHQATAETRNLFIVAQLMIEFALKRTESRGSHFRADFLKRADSVWQVHQNQTKLYSHL